MKLSDTLLPSDPVVMKAWNAMAHADADPDIKKFSLKMAEIVNADCADAELGAGAISVVLGARLPPKYSAIH